MENQKNKLICPNCKKQIKLDYPRVFITIECPHCKHPLLNLTSERLMPSERGIRYYEHIKRYLFALNYTKGKKVLDVACGSGYGSDILTRNAKYVYGIDIDKETIAFAQKRYYTNNITFKNIDATKTKFKDNTFDIIVSFETLEHIKSYNKLLMEFKRILKNNGTLVISTPNKATFGCNLETPFDSYHIKEFHLDEFCRLLKKSGFKIKELWGQSLSKKLRWIYPLRCLVVTIPFFGKIISTQCQNYMENSNKKVDNIIIQFITKLLKTKLSLQEVKLSKKDLLSAIYFIAICNPHP